MDLSIQSQWGRTLFGGGILIIVLIFIVFVGSWPIASNKPVTGSFLDTNGAPKALVFFGFPGCSEVCPLTLAAISQSINQLRIQPQVIFIDIDPNSSPSLSQQYAQQFHPNFVGRHISTANSERMKAQFGLNISQHGELIKHQGKTYILEQRDGRWWVVKAYNPNSFSADTLSKEVHL